MSFVFDSLLKRERRQWQELEMARKTEYGEFLRYLEAHEEREWVDMAQIAWLFPGIDATVLNRLVDNGRVELKEGGIETGHIRLTHKGRKKVRDRNSVRPTGALGIFVMLILFFALRIAPKIDGVYLDQKTELTIPEDAKALMDSMLMSRMKKLRFDSINLDSLSKPLNMMDLEQGLRKQP